jgi:hypothetical protein
VTYAGRTAAMDGREEPGGPSTGTARFTRKEKRVTPDVDAPSEVHAHGLDEGYQAGAADVAASQPATGYGQRSSAPSA